MMIWECSTEGNWIATEVSERDAFALDSEVSLIRWADGRECGLLTRADVDINGAPALPFQVLVHRDEIRAAGKLFCFSVASPAQPSRFVPAPHEVLCARCGVALLAGAKVLHCPLCRAPHHQECFDYAPECGACREETSWTPEAIGAKYQWR